MFSSARIGRPAATRADQRQPKLLAHRVAAAGCRASAGQQLNHPFARQRAQVLLGRVGRAKTEFGRNFGPRRRHTGLGKAALDEAQYPGLAWCQIGHTVIIYSKCDRVANPVDTPAGDRCELRCSKRCPNDLSASADSGLRYRYCISSLNLVKLAAAKSPRSGNVRRDAVFIQCKSKGTDMNKSIVVKLAAAVAVVALAGCTDLKPLQADVDSLKQQVSKLQTDVEAAKASADSASRAASAAQSSANQAATAASGAQSTANQALSAAQAAQSSVDATNEKIDRMFKKSVSK